MKIKNFGCRKEDDPLAEGYSYGLILATPPKPPIHTCRTGPNRILPVPFQLIQPNNNLSVSLHLETAEYCWK